MSTGTWKCKNMAKLFLPKLKLSLCVSVPPPALDVTLLLITY